MAAGEVVVAGAHRRIIEEGKGQAGVLWREICGEAHHLLPSSRMAQTQDVVAMFGVGGQHSGGGRPLPPAGAGRRGAPEGGIHGGTADPERPGHGGEGRSLRPEHVHGVIDRDPAGVRLPPAAQG